MTWFDVVALLLLALIAWLESLRGFGRALFDVIGAIIALKVASVLSGPLGNSMPLFGAGASSEAFWYATSFVVLCALVVIGSKVIYETTLLSLDVFDPVVGGLLGAASGMVVGHVFLTTLLTIYGDAEAANILTGSFAGQELIRFRTYHHVITWLQNLGNW